MRVRPHMKAGKRAIYSNARNAMIVIAILFSIIISQILLSVATSSGAYEIASNKENLKQLTQTYDKTYQIVTALSSPQNLAAQAENLGMVSNNTPAFLRLSDGAVLGSPTPASPDAKLIIDGASIPNAQLDSIINKKSNVEESITQPKSVVVNATNNSNTPQVLTNGLPAVLTH